MTPSRTIAAESVIALAGSVFGDLRAQGPARGLPRPRAVMSILLAYGMLSVLSGFGRGGARLAASVGGVLMLTILVLGPSGKGVNELLASAARFAQFTPGPVAQVPQFAVGGGPGRPRTAGPSGPVGTPTSQPVASNGLSGPVGAPRSR